MQQNSNNIRDIPNELFLANAVHEIRTPVQTIIGTLDLLSDTQMNTEQTEYVRQIRFGAEVLLALVNDILDFSKIKSHKMLLENVPYDIKDLVENVVHLISIEAFNKKLEIVTDIDYSLPEMIMGDPTRVQQILINLLKNAVKFTNQGYIHTELKKDGDFLLIKITDSGIGVSKDKENNLFESFDQGDPSISRKYGGTGLGLPICKGLVSKMNGSIGFTPNPYGGSCFWVKIPLSAADDSKKNQYVLPVPATTKILIVDDSILAAKSLENKLKTIGLQNIQISQNGDDAYLKLQYAEQIDNPYDIVFIDKIMPVVEGWHLASNIKNNPKIKKTKLYMLVPEGQVGRDAKMKLLDWFAGYLYKPVRLEKLDQLLIETNGSDSSIKLFEEINSINKNSENTTKKQTELPQIAEGMKILVTDDHPVNRKILVEFLKKFGAAVYEAENGEAAIKMIREHSEIQVVFMDIQMPVLSGIETTKILRKENFSGLIIACTANNDPENFKEYQRIGMNDILVKPFKRKNIENMLDKWSTVINLPSASQIASVDSDMMLNNELWNSADFEDTIGNDVDLGKQILLDYIDQTKSFIVTAYDLLDNKDFEELHRVSHTLKGSSAAISANKLVHISTLMSQATKSKNAEEFRKNLEDFEEYFDLFILATTKWKHFSARI
ncbi:MAG: response regulator [Spirochaetia bacterium]|nr:response regulator [Spirochaetia bacterium]